MSPPDKATLFAQKIANQLYTIHPDWKVLSTIDERGCLEINIPPPSENVGGTPMRIYVDDEIHVDFDFFHAHFGSYATEKSWGEQDAASPFIAGLLNDEIRIISWWNGDKMLASSYCRKNETPNSVTMNHCTHIRYRSWRGTLNADIECALHD